MEKEKQVNGQSKKRISELNEILKVINKILRHDLLNHLATVSMALDIYQNKKDEKYIKSAFRGIDRGIDLIQQMKKLEPLVETEYEIKSIYVREKIESVISPYQIDYSIDGNCHVLADQALNLVIENIVENAIKHGKADRLDFILEMKEKTCSIIISDNGTGIPLDIRKRIFEVGFSHGENRGTGLGLYVVKKVVERYGGDIKVQENMPTGVSFVITLERAL